jgi:hypothetical protein
VALKEAIDNHKPFLDNKYSKWYMELLVNGMHQHQNQMMINNTIGMNLQPLGT